MLQRCRKRKQFLHEDDVGYRDVNTGCNGHRRGRVLGWALEVSPEQIPLDLLPLEGRWEEIGQDERHWGERVDARLRIGDSIVSIAALRVRPGLRQRPLQDDLKIMWRA